MTHEMLHAIGQSTLDKHCKAVLYALAAHCNPGGRCYPGIDTLVRYTGLSERAVQMAVKEMTGKAIEVARLPGIRTDYRLRFDWLKANATPAPGAPVHTVHPNPRTVCTPPPHTVHPTPAPGAPEASNEVSTEEEQLPGSGPTPTPTPAPVTGVQEERPAPGAPPKRSAAQRVYAAWRAHHPRSPEAPSKANGKLIEARLAETASRYGVDSDAEALAVAVVEWAHRAPDAAFFRGENDRGQAYLGIDTLFKAARWDDRVEKALRWRDAASGSAAPNSQSASTRIDGWASWLRVARQPRRDNPPGRAFGEAGRWNLHETAEVHTRLRRCLDQAGGWTRWCGDEFAKREFEKAFRAAWEGGQ